MAMDEETYSKAEVLAILSDFVKRAEDKMNSGFYVLSDIDDILDETKISDIEIKLKKRIRKKILDMGNWVLNESKNLMHEFGG